MKKKESYTGRVQVAEARAKKRTLATRNAKSVAIASEKRAALTAAVAAFDAMPRPKAPPPTRFDRMAAPTAGARALARDIRTGVIRPRRAYFGPST